MATMTTMETGTTVTPGATTTTLAAGTTETPPGPPAAVVADETISITDSGFVPNTLTVPTGTTVGWTNDASTNQTVSANGEAGFFDSGLLAPGDTYSYTFNGVGNYTYQSMIGGFEGEIFVTP
jgi:plastocyanin